MQMLRLKRLVISISKLCVPKYIIHMQNSICRYIRIRYTTIRICHALACVSAYLDDAQSVDCDCGEPQTMAHILSCRLLDEARTADDLATVTERAKACARKWENIV